MEKYFQNNKWQLLSLGWAILVIALLWLYIIPEFHKTMQLYSDLRGQQDQIKSAQNLENCLSQLNKQQEKLESYFSKIFVSLPENDQMSTIVDQLFKEARGENIKLVSMRPSERIQYKAYEEIPISIEVLGTFHEIAQYIGSIEQSKYLMKVERIYIQSEENPEANLNAQLAVKVIILKKNSKETGDTDA